MRIAGIPDEVERAQFGQLEPGIAVWLMGCERCAPGDGGKHRAILIRRIVTNVRTPDGERYSALPVWMFAPEASCGSQAFDEETADSGHVYRIVDARYDAERDTIARVRKLSVRT